MRCRRLVPLAIAVLGWVAACSSGGGSDANRTSGAAAEPTASEVTVTATAPPVPAGTKDCGTQNDLAGWPTTMVSSPDAYACIVDALAAGTPAQMSSVTVGNGQSGRTTGDGYEIPTRRIVTWVVLGPGEVEETIDRTEDGGERTTRICAAFTAGSFGVPVSGTNCR